MSEEAKTGIAGVMLQIQRHASVEVSDPGVRERLQFIYGLAQAVLEHGDLEAPARLRAELSASEERQKGLRERADNFRGALVRAEVAIMTRTYSADGSEWRGCPVCRRAMTEHTPECPFALLSA